MLKTRSTKPALTANMKSHLEAIHSPVTSVALKREVVLGVGGVHVLDGHPPLNTAESKPSWS